MRKWITMLCLAVLMFLATGSETVLANDNTENTKVENFVETEADASRVKATGSNEYVSNINVNTTYTGQLLARDEVEIYNFTLSSAGMVNVTFQHANLYDAECYWVVRIYNDNAEYLMQMDVVGTDTNITSVDVGLPAGDYYAQVISGYKFNYNYGHSTETYTFKVNYTKSSVWETENNNEYKNADVIGLNTNYSGANQFSDDIDSYKFSLSHAGMISVNFQHANISDTDRYWVIRIYNESTECLMQLNSAGTDTNITGAEVGLPAGDYYVQVISGYKFNYNYGHSIETYTFKVNYTKSSVWETENNNEHKNADVIGLNTNYSGASQFSDDIDSYKFSLTHAGMISVNFQHANISDTDRYWVIRIYNESTECLMQLNSAGTDTNITGAEVGLPAGDYYVQVISGYKFNYNYGHSTETYTFKVNYTKSFVWETENNNSYANADNVSINKEYNGAIQFSNELDYYKFTVKKAGNFTINFQHTNLKDVERYWVVHLYDDTTKELIALDIAGSGKSVNSGSIYLQKGTYYLRINADDYESWSSNYSDDSYKFKVAYTFTTKKTTVKTASVDYNKIKLSWKKISDVDGYIVYRSTSKNGTYKAVKTIKGKSNCTYTDKSVKTGKTYYYKVRGYKKISKTTYYSKYSSVLKVKAVPAKASIKSVKAGTRRAIITWKKQSGVSGYEVYMSTKKSSGYKKITTVTKASKVKYSKSKLKEGKTYYFKVRAYKVVNGKKVYGKYSSVKSVRIVWK